MAIGQQGKAFISVEADLKPFAKELNRQIPVILKETETAAKKSLGDAGKKGGESFNKGLKDSTKKKNGSTSAFLGLTSSLAAALDDGISALPTEVKAALVVGIAAALPIVGALLTGAISLALIAGFGAIGVLIAAQYDVVRLEGAELFNDLRNILVGAGAAFVEPVLDAINLLRDGVQALSTPLSGLFGTASKFIIPLTKALLNFVGAALPGLQESLEDMVSLLPTLEEGFQTLGEGLGTALTIITGSNEAETSLKTLLGTILALTIAAAILIRVLTELWGQFLALLPFTSPFLLFLADTTDANIALAKSEDIATQAQNLSIAATNAQGVAMRKQAAATKAAQKAIDDFIDAQYDYAHSQIDFERALDNVTEAITRQGRTLDITTEAGRKAREGILTGLEAARKERDDAISSGKLSEADAETRYQKELTRLRNRALQAGVTKKAYDDLAASVGAVGSSPIDLFLSKKAQDTIRRIRDAVNAVLSLGAYRPPAPSSNPRNRPPTELALGGVFDSPTLAVIGEAGPEAVVPLNRPERAAQVMAEAGLGSQGDVYVYVGADQLDARMYRVARGAQRQQATRLYAGTRAGF